MAFATSNVRSGTIGGNLKYYAGDWTGSAGDASGSVSLRGGRVYLRQFQNLDADSPKEETQTDISVSDGTITITVHNHLSVTNGTFLIIFA